MRGASLRKLSQLLLVGLFLAFLGGEFIGTIAVKKETISKEEKRKLATLPALSLTPESLATFPTAFEKYWSDHFLFRKQFVALNSLLQFKLFNRLPTSAVMAGSDGWLFMMSGTLYDYLGMVSFTDKGKENWKKVIERRRRWLNTWGGHYLMAIAPNKTSAYSEHLPLRLQGKQGSTTLQKMADYLEDTKLAGNLLDLRIAMNAAKQEKQAYFKTDTHWNSYGAYKAYLAIMESIRQWYPSARPLSVDRLVPNLTGKISGDLALMTGLPHNLMEESIDWTIGQACAPKKTRRLVTPLLEPKHYPRKNGCKTGIPLRVLVISDSFGSALEQYLSETFVEVLYDRSLEFNEMIPFIASYKPDIVLHLHVERFMVTGFGHDPALAQFR